MKCLNCGREISGEKRMCDDCARAMVERLAQAAQRKKEQEKTGQTWQPPAGAPTGVVKTWKPKKKENSVIKGSLPSIPPDTPNFPNS